MKEGVYFPHRDCGEISLELKKNAASAHLSQLLWGSGILWQSRIPACNNQRSLSSCPKSSLTGCPLACDELFPRASSLAGSCAPPGHFLKMGNHPMTWSVTFQMETRLGEGKVALNSSSPPRNFPLPPCWLPTACCMYLERHLFSGH